MGAPQIIRDSDVPNRELAYVHDASDESVRTVLDAGANTEDGRSGWVWLRLPNGDLILGVFPRGDTYFAVEEDAAFPRAPEPPFRIPGGWEIVGYRRPQKGERYFDGPRAQPWVATRLVYSDDVWIVKKAAS